MKTKFLMAGLLAGAVGFGVGCKTDSTNMSRDPQATMPAPANTPDEMGTGGTGIDTPQSEPMPETMPDDGLREREPNVHNTPIEEPGTGGAGLEPEGLQSPDTLGNDTEDKRLNKDMPIDSSVDDNTLTEDSVPPQKP